MATQARLLPPRKKVRITIRLDEAIVEEFKRQAAEKDVSYQWLINQVLRHHTNLHKPGE